MSGRGCAWLGNSMGVLGWGFRIKRVCLVGVGFRTAREGWRVCLVGVGFRAA